MTLKAGIACFLTFFTNILYSYYNFDKLNCYFTQPKDLACGYIMSIYINLLNGYTKEINNLTQSIVFFMILLI